ncbi:hypothetical protein PHYBLDRAFT_138365 [Phycomyces blakesleeanus NRRL 1555(-)]|uniref:Homeodomain-like DNA binding domain-containing transcription factor n=1 Tax=Phycomyces blakesleeanus (strain ATCC 8743b / DSM 1359 / FGSC 10004 / NBRC 33097 / NRRL 1555) TaxID=763407 RepID=A0A162YHZ5_PHYB8|nr:hypothetical protein PHYBLDRAFT_138365 [Phycomyces blakesleeanus NRRL 1555(-)]OAD80815.1 hypothetical protein PHYBLDRAFT_138365 [Phycomyces blakesleeanus NRRL 1555(-)]|eukprot:XP_018298855.1 hypothetical protein PHYBLDRAFT_138365 [Phycomyces blakesleeanus NRRL 1555(-)]
MSTLKQRHSEILQETLRYRERGNVPIKTISRLVTKYETPEYAAYKNVFDRSKWIPTREER